MAGLLALGLAGAAGVALAAERPILDVQDPAVLEALEAQGLSLGAVLGRPGLRTTRELKAGSAVMRVLSDQVAADVAALRSEMVANGRVLDESRPGEAGGAFDPRWLDSPIAGFRLAGVINRLDRQDFAAIEGKATCGEVRLIYRLAYRTERKGGMAVHSRLPFTLNAVYDVARPADGDCRAAARAWVPAGPQEDATAQARFLAQGPLAGALALRQVEINAQIVRFPSGVEPTFGGQAAYLLRVFGIERSPAGPAASVRPLENTPDLARLKTDAALRRDLVEYLRANVAALDQGVYALPERFAATKAVAFSTFGSARLGNRPFTELLSPQDFAGLDLAALPFARSAEALIERLDNSTCQGCHQAGATAGFHFLGLDRREASSHNRLAVGASPHFAAETKRREAYLDAVLADAEPNRFRPISTAPAADWSGVRPAYRPAGTAMACIRDASRALLGEAWTCGAGETCEGVVENARLGIEYGQCMPKREVSGIACRAGRIVNAASAPYGDRMTLTRQLNSLARRPTAFVYNCRPPEIGVPGGMAYRQCSADDRAFAGFAGAAPGEIPAEICGLAGGKGFDRCVASKDVAGCLHGAVARGNRPACGRDRFCREDFICQALPDEVDPDNRVPDDIGFCSPTYFVFQMRLDGHPDPLRAAVGR
ncbi:MAG TPA: hypothetical protein VHL98_15100 [Microvirga sp.]|jgi:hypothetical protein|nr:hypothetical protein [Microvirga sp.]